MDLLTLAAKMKGDWDRRARENARFYIASDDWENDEVFRASGVRDAGLVTRGLEGLLRPEMRVLEIGCGIGRLLRVLASRFAELHGVDVSGEMIRRGREWLADCPNVFLHETNGVNLGIFPDRYFDFVYSYVTFQHMPNTVVASYCREVRRVLAPRGWFRFQVFSFERVDGAKIESPPDDTFALRSVSDTELEAMLREVRLEPTARHEIHVPDGYVPDYQRIRQVWITCRRRPRGRLRPRPALVVEIEQASLNSEKRIRNSGASD